MRVRNHAAGVRVLILAAHLLAIPLALTATAQTLPGGWTSGDIGSPARRGSATSSGGTFTVSGAGIDIWSSADQFRFVYRRVTGDVDLVARVSSLQNVRDWTKGGLMIRQSLEESAAHASVLVSPARGVAFQRRPHAGGESLHTDGGAGKAPVWLKLARRGSVVTAYRSSNGVAWATIGRQTVSLSDAVYVGLAVTSHSAAAVAKGTFQGVAIEAVALPAKPPATAAAPGPPAVSSAAASGTKPVTVSLTSPTHLATYERTTPVTVSATADASLVSRMDFYAGSTLLGSDTTSPYQITVKNTLPGRYSLVAAARTRAGGTTVSSARDIIVHDAAMPRRAVFQPSPNHARAVQSYLLEIFPAAGNPALSNPVATQDLGKPPIVNGECAVDISRTMSALAPGSYVAVVTAVGLRGLARSVKSPPFTR